MRVKKKELIIISSIAALVVLLLGAYLVLKPMLEEGDETSRAPSIFVYERISREDIKTLKVVNENGGFELYRIDNKLFFKDAEFVPYNEEKVSELVVNSTFMIAMRKLDDVEDYGLYGLDIEADAPPYFELTTTKDIVHKVYIGDSVQNEVAYYVRYDGSDTIYVVDGSLGSTHLVQTNDYLLPHVSIQISTPTQYANINQFYLSKRVDDKLTGLYQIRAKTEEEKANSSETFPYIIVYPKTHYNTSTDAFSTVQSSLAAMVGTKVVDYGIIPAIENDDPEAYAAYQERLAKWGLDAPEYEVAYNYNGDGYLIYFSKADEDGNLYAYSIKMTSVVQIHSSQLPFLDWGIKDFIDRMIFSHNISTVKKIKTTINDKDYVYELSKDSQGLVGSVTADGKPYDLPAFKKYYITMLQMSLVDYSEPPKDDRAPILTYTVEGSMGTLKYEFYRTETRRCYFTINGKGEFYTGYDLVKKMIDQTEKIAKGEVLTDE